MAVRTEVVIIGAGLSGLSAAKYLTDKGVDVIVLEASDRLGGRLYSIKNDAVGYADLGGGFIGPTQDRVLKLAKELGLQTKDVYSENSVVSYRRGKIMKFSGVLPPMRSISDAMDNYFLLRKIHEISEKMPLNKPWKTPDAETLDRTSYQEWLNKLIKSERVKDLASMNVRLNMSGEPYELSLLWTLWYMKSAGGILRINAIEGGAQEKTFINGAQQLATKLAEKLPDKVLTDKAVCRIQQSGAGVMVETMDGGFYEADYVILATAPSVQSRIIYDPPLPPLRNQLIHRAPQGSVIKTITYYSRPYWREKGLSGMIYVEENDDLDFPVINTIDDTKPDGSFAALIGFVIGDQAKRMTGLKKEERMKRIANQYAKIFECKEMASPIHYEDKNWSEDPWVGGCYTAIMGPGAMTTFGKVIREPIDRIHFAGTETAAKWSGYMDGAIEAGERAAREILYRVGKCKKEDIFDEDSSHDDLDLTFAQKHFPSKGDTALLLKTIGVALAAGVTGKYLWSKL